MTKTDTPVRFVPIHELQNLLRLRQEVDKKLYAFPIEHCRICGDTTPKHGFYPLWGMAHGEGIYQTSGLMCNRCARTDKDYEDLFGEPKENIKTLNGVPLND